MYKTTTLAAKDQLKRLKIAMIDTRSGIVYYIDDGLHEVLAREICEAKKYDWQCEGKFIGAVDYLLNRREFIKLSNYEPAQYQYLAVDNKALFTSKKVKEWLDYLVYILRLEIQTYC